MNNSTASPEVPRSAVVAVVVVIAALLLGGIWWKTGTHTRENAYSAAVTNRESSEQFRQEMQSQLSHRDQPTAGTTAARESSPEFIREHSGK